MHQVHLFQKVLQGVRYLDGSFLERRGQGFELALGSNQVAGDGLPDMSI
jgi:hypothetical protein